MPTIRTIARTSILKPVVQKDGKTKLVEVGKNVRSESSASSNNNLTSVNKVIQSGTSINPGDAPSSTPNAVIPVSRSNTYYLHMPSHNLTATIMASSIDEAFGIFANQNGIAASEREILITEFVP